MASLVHNELVKNWRILKRKLWFTWQQGYITTMLPVMHWLLRVIKIYMYLHENSRFQLFVFMDLLPDTWNCVLRMRRECRERFPRHRLQKKPLVSDPDMHHATCVTHVPWCMSVSLTRGGGENVPGIPGACATRKFTYLARVPCFPKRANLGKQYASHVIALAICFGALHCGEWWKLGFHAIIDQNPTGVSIGILRES